MGHEYIKENDTFNLFHNGTVPKPTAEEVLSGKVLGANGQWVEGGGSGDVSDVKVNGESVLDQDNVAQIKSYKEVTQAQYEALPDTKLTDGILYAIKDVGGPDSFPPLIYSDEEREVGVWRDGKPLYQKTIYYDNADGISDTSQHDYEIATIPNIYLANSSGYLVNSSTGNSYALPYSVGSKGITVVYKNNEKVYLRTIGDTWGNAWKFYITIQYTKTTDTPGSGTWGTINGIQQDVTSLISPHSGVTLASGFVYKAFKTGKVITFFAKGQLNSGYSEYGTRYSMFDIDSSISPSDTAFSCGLGSDSRIANCRVTLDSTIDFDGGIWCGFQISWYID